MNSYSLKSYLRHNSSSKFPNIKNQEQQNCTKFPQVCNLSTVKVQKTTQRIEIQESKTFGLQIKKKEERSKPLGTELGWIAGDSQEPGILGTCSRARLGLRQFKGACQGTQGSKTDMSISATQ